MIAAALAFPAFGAAAGACAGSFIAAVTLRWPQGRGFLGGRSHCETCQRTLGPAELVPIVSYAVLGGKCRTCRAPIGWRQPAVEIAAAVIGAMALATDPAAGLAAGLAVAMFGWMLLALLILDVEHFWLPDALTLPLAILGIADGVVFGGDVASRLIGLAVGYGSLALIALLYKLRTGREGIGGGDPKLFGAIGAWLGWQAQPSVLVVAALGGLGWVAVERWRTGTRPSATTRLAFGACLAVAAWVLQPLGPAGLAGMAL